MKEIGPEEELGYLQDMFGALRKVTPGTSEWFSVVQYCVESLLQADMARVRSAASREKASRALTASDSKED